MTTRIEDVLLQMGEVRYKKGDGTLYVMNERLAWMAENRDTVAVSHRFADIKMQKISPEGKPKVQLQVVLHDGNSSTFHFVNRNGQKAMLEDRDKVKELLQQLLPNFKRQVNKELEEKNRLLVENPTLLQLYKDLVTTKVLTSEEFWENHARDHAMNTVIKKQDIGVSADFLADIKPQTDGCNGLKYNLNADIIQCIFKTYPAVKRKYIENVPIKMSESDFWTKFFQSHYFHRDRITTGTKDIFTECGKIDEQTLKVDLQRGAGDPLLDIRQFQDVTLEEGFGGTDERHISNSGNIVHQNMIKRFNQHSFMVLKTCADVNDSGSAKGPLTSSGVKDAGTNVVAGEMPKSSKSKHDTTRNTSSSESTSTVEPTNRKRVMEKIYYEDLGQPLLEKDTCAEVNARNILVGLDRAKYLGGPISVNNYESNDDLHQSEEMHCNLKRSIEASLHRQSYKLFINPTAAVNALGELSPGGAMMRGFQEEATAHLVPDEFEKDLRNLYLTLSELLKHFWACFPPTTRELQEKVVRTHESLQRFQMAKVVPFESRVLHELSPLGSSLTQHLNRLLQAANTKFARWKERKMRQHR